MPALPVFSQDFFKERSNAFTPIPAFGRHSFCCCSRLLPHRRFQRRTMPTVIVTTDPANVTLAVASTKHFSAKVTGRSQYSRDLDNQRRLWQCNRWDD